MREVEEEGREGGTEKRKRGGKGRGGDECGRGDPLNIRQEPALRDSQAREETCRVEGLESGDIDWGEERGERRGGGIWDN